MNRKSFVATGVVVLSALTSSALVASQSSISASSAESFVSGSSTSYDTQETPNQGIYAPGSSSAITPAVLSTSKFNSVFDSRFIQYVTA